MTRGGGWDGLLEDGETILWPGQPDPGMEWRGLLSPISLFGLVFAGVGLYLLAVRLFVDARQRPKTWYTLTTKWAFVAEERFGHKGLEAYPVVDMPPADLIDGRPGDAIFGSVTQSMPPRRPGPHKSRNRLAGSMTARVGFFRIHDARKVWGALRDRRAALLTATRDLEPEGDA